MAENKNIVIRLMADTASYEAAMTRAGSTAKTVASGMEHTGRKSALIASGMTAAGLAVAAFGVAAVKMAADFDRQMSTVQRTPARPVPKWTSCVPPPSKQELPRFIPLRIPLMRSMISARPA